MDIPKALDPAEAIQKALPDALQDVKTFRGETTLVIVPAQLVKVAQFFRDTAGLVYNYLSDISAVDYAEVSPVGSVIGISGRPERFGVSYHLYSMLYNRRLRLKVFLPEDDPQVSTVTGIWPGANWLEREIYDLMGVTFVGHPNMKRVLLPDDWDGHPHRRDYPLGYETVQFSFNVDEILKHKPFAKE
ncbi:MAG: NADH-quinone oxidoreductase subunit C [Anaerolineaceae bacterium]|nr:NADH-quinone oxidoreductase subunit C [Anaerolineaceae bacterium]